MNEEELIEMAEKSGFMFTDGSPIGFTRSMLKDFAKLVAEFEREECAKICDKYALEDHENWAGGCAFAIRKRGKND